MKDSFFELVFDEVTLEEGGETQVRCPFPHSTSEGETYYEQVPSASVNLDKNLYYCHACGVGLNEIGFIAKYMNLSYSDANKFKNVLDNYQETITDWEDIAHKELLRKDQWMNTLKELGISEETVKELRLGYTMNHGIDFPVALFGQVVDVSTYRPGKTPKVIRRRGSTSGLINPYDLWREDDSPTVICAGEKDMAIAREKGLNAITITGGETALPELFKEEFRNRKVYIVYDNDETGRMGANNLAIFLYDVASSVRVVDLSDTCQEKGEDLWDFYMKYGKTKKDFVRLAKNTPPFNEEKYQNEKEKIYPTLPLIKAGQPKYNQKTIRSNVQVISVYETQFSLPSAISARKEKIDQDGQPAKNRMNPGETRNWYLNEKNMKDILYLIDSRLKEKDIYKHKRELLGISHKEENVKIWDDSKETVYKCTVTDILDTDSESQQRMEFTAYSINNKLENGKKYKLTYRLVPHPFEGQKFIMIILDTEDVNDTINSFKLTNEKIERLRKFQVEDSLENTIDQHVERIKGMTNIDHNEKLALLIDLFYHSVFRFNIGRFKNIRGTLDMMIVGETRTGKSEIAKTLHNMYGVGQIISLASATEPSIVGGSNIVQGSYQTRAGVLPMNHGGAVIFEELAKSRDHNILKKLTEVKSSGMARISRVNGTIELPAIVRMLTITNTKMHGSSSKPITAYPNGIEIVTDLVGAAEDIARFDLIALFAFNADQPMDAFPEFEEPFKEEDYRTKISWIWSRDRDQIYFGKETFQYLIKQSNKLKEEFRSHIKVFGSETWKKLSRLSIAVAAYVVSTDSDFEKIVVKQEHIDYAIKLMRSMYDNEVFALKQYIQEERIYREIDEDGIDALQNLFNKAPEVLFHLEQASKTTRNNLQAVSGMDPTDFSKVIKSLAQSYFIQFHNYDIHPTERFRKGMKKINRKMHAPKIGSVKLNEDDDVV